MSGVKPITSYFKVLTKDELEIEELIIESQSSILSKTISNQSTRKGSTLSDKNYDSYIDLTEEEPEEFMPALADYYSSDDDDDDDDDVLPVALATPTVGDSIFSALDRALGSEPVVFSSNQAPHRKKREIREYNSRPVNWVEIAD
jgi:hypothetical protein